MTAENTSAELVADLGAHGSAVLLSAKLGIPVTPDAIAELGRLGLIPVAGTYKGYPLYDGHALDAFDDPEGAAAAARLGKLRTADESAAYLGVRRSDFAHLTRAGLLRPVKYGRGPYDRRGWASVPLYRTGDLDQLAADAGIDWDAVRATPRGRRSPLAALPDAGGAS